MRKGFSTIVTIIAILIILGVLLWWLLKAPTSRAPSENEQQAEVQSSTSTDASDLEREADEVIVEGNIDADFETIDRDLNSL